MASAVSMEGIKRAIFFPFQGKNWSNKVVLGAAVNFANFVIPLIPLVILLGYTGQMMKCVIIHDDDPELPDWTDWGTYFLDGLKMFGVLVIYGLPGILVALFGYFLLFFLGFGMNFVGSYFAIASSNGNASSLIPFLFSMLATVVGTFGGMLCMGIGVFLFFISMVLFEPAIGNMIAKGSFGAAFRAKEWWPVFKANLTGYLLVSIFSLGLTFALLLVIQFLYMTVILCFLLPFVAGFLGFIIGTAVYSLYAIAYRDGVRMLTGMEV